MHSGLACEVFWEEQGWFKALAWFRAGLACPRLAPRIEASLYPSVSPLLLVSSFFFFKFQFKISEEN